MPQISGKKSAQMLALTNKMEQLLPFRDMQKKSGYLELEAFSGWTFYKAEIYRRSIMNKIKKSKKFPAMLISAAMAVSMLPAAVYGADISYQDGTYEGTGTGFGGEVTARVVIADGRITEVTSPSHEGETFWESKNVDSLFEKIIEANSADVDVVSGATKSSNGLKEAVADALSKAGSSIYLDGVNGDDENNGLSDETAVKTFSKAKELIGNKTGVIYIIGSVSVDSQEEWSLDTDGAVYLERGPAYTGSLVEVGDGGELSLSDIIIDGGEISAQSAAVKVNDGGILNIGDGTVIRNNKNMAQYGTGGGVFAVGDVNMTGGSIYGNSANEGGGIAVEKITFRDNTTPCLNFSGGEIRNNQASSGGGAYTWFGEINVSGGEITGNTAETGGGVGFWGTGWGGTGSFTGGSITENSASSGGGIGGSVMTALKFGNGAVVKDNTNTSGENNNIELDGDIEIVSALSGSKAVGVTGIDGTVAALGTGSYTLTESDAAAFFADDPMMETYLDSEKNQVILRIAPAEEQLAEVYMNGIDGSNSNDGKTAETAVKSFGQAKALLADDGVIYITDMVTVTSRENWNLSDRGNARIERHSSYIGEEPGDEHGHDYINGPLIEVNGDSADLTLNNMTIDGADIEAVTGLVTVKKGSLTINEGVVLQNAIAANHNGGGLYIYGDGQAAVNGVVIKNNESVGYAGGIYNGGILTLNGAEITGNTAGYNAGGILNNGTMNIKGRIIVNGNVVKAGGKETPSNMVFASGKYATVTGAFSDGSDIGVDSYVKPANIMRPDSWNHPVWGPMVSYAPTEDDMAKLNLDDESGKYKLELADNNININLTAEADAGAVYLDPSAGNDEYDGSEIAKAVKTLDKAMDLANASDGGKIYLVNSIPIESSVTVDGENAVIARYFSFLGDMFAVSGGELELKNITIDGGSEEGITANGSIVKVEKGASLNISEGAVLKNNSAVAAGGAVNNSGKAVMSGGTIENCKTTSRSGGGGVFNASGAEFTVSGGTISKCEAFSGGGIETEGTLNITGGTISENSVRGGGGGVHLFGEGTNAAMTMSGGTIEKNTSSEYYGGGIFLWGGSLDISGGTVKDNTALDNAGIHAISKVNLSGSVHITDNKNSNGRLSNLCVMDVDESTSEYTTKPAFQTGAFTDDARVFINGSGKVVEGGGYTITKDDVSRYGSDLGYTASLQNNDVYMKAKTPSGGGGGGGSSAVSRFTLTYETNGGSEIKAESYSSDTQVTLDKTPVREGYTFTGWYLDKELTNKITSVQMNSSKTVYAGWSDGEQPVKSDENTPLMVIRIGDTKYQLNGADMEMDSAPFIDDNDRTMLPVRVVANALGISDDDIAWDNETKTASFTRPDGKVVSCTVGSNIIRIGDEEIEIDTAPVIVNDRIFLPMRALFNAFNVSDEHILWDGETKTVTVTKEALEDIKALAEESSLEA